MRNTRGSSGSVSRAERADAASRRLALLAADLGAPDRAAPLNVPDPADPPDPTDPPDPPDHSPLTDPRAPTVVPRPGRHADRRRPVWSSPPALGLPGLGPTQLTVLAVIVAAGVALTAWWVVRNQATPGSPVVGPQPTSVAPLVAGPSDPAPTGPDSASTAGTVTVDVTGKVRRPGIVVLDAGARVVDALAKAGGERAGVDLSSLNLARVLVDGEQIVVGVPRQVPVAPSGSTTPGAPPVLVNINTASQAELETLPEVGPVTALAIITWREEHGGFTSVDELLEVDGIGDATLSRMAPYVTI